VSRGETGQQEGLAVREISCRVREQAQGINHLLSAALAHLSPRSCRGEISTLHYWWEEPKEFTQKKQGQEGAWAGGTDHWLHAAHLLPGSYQACGRPCGCSQLLPDCTRIVSSSSSPHVPCTVHSTPMHSPNHYSAQCRAKGEQLG